MTKLEFKNIALQQGVYMASLLANSLGVKIAIVQLWLRTI